MKQNTMLIMFQPVPTTVPVTALGINTSTYTKIIVNMDNGKARGIFRGFGTNGILTFGLSGNLPTGNQDIFKINNNNKYLYTTMLNSIRAFIHQTTQLQPDSLSNLTYRNIVTTSRLTFSCIPSESLMAQCMNANISSTPRRFAGIKIKVKDAIGKCTHLLFRSGKMNTVGACSIEHARYSVQYTRQCLERTKGVFFDENKNLVISTLGGRLDPIHFAVQLLVVNARLDVRPNLKYLMQVLPDLAQWNPESFPGLKFLMWVKPKAQCTCVSKKGTRNCRCNVKVVIFDSGKIIITGNRSVHDVNTAMTLLKNLFSDSKYQADTKQVEKRKRFQARRALLLSNVRDYIEFSGVNNCTKPPVSVFEALSARKHKKRKVDNPIAYACEMGQVENIQLFLQTNPAEVRNINALQRLKAIPEAKKTNAHYKIIYLLEQCGH